MNLLIDALPDSVEADGVSYRINTDFRVFVLLETLLRDSGVLWPDKVKLALSCFYSDGWPANINTAFERLIWFYRCGEPPEAAGGETIKKTMAPAYSFSQDGGAIVAAFMERYHINLTEVSLHWWVFRTLFDSLISGVGFSEIVRCRVADTRGMDRRHAAYYRAMKAAYGLERAVGVGQALSYAARNQRMVEYVERRFRETGMDR